MSDAVGEVTPVAARPKAWVFGRLPAGIVASNPAGGNEFLCCQCYMSKCGREAATSRSPGPPEAVASTDAAISGFDVLCRVWVLNFAPPPLSHSLAVSGARLLASTPVSLSVYILPLTVRHQTPVTKLYVIITQLLFSQPPQRVSV